MYILADKTAYHMKRIKELLGAKGMNQTPFYAANRLQSPISVLCCIADILKVDVRELLVENKVLVEY